MSIKKAYMMAMAMAALAAGGYKERFEESEYVSVFCGDCKHCPQGKKTFCKQVRRSVTKHTPAHKCKFFINNLAE